MLDLFHNEKCTLRRSEGRTGRNDADFKEVTGPDGAPIIIKARLDRRVQRRRSLTGVEILGDASMVYAENTIKGQEGFPREWDRVVTPRGEVFSVASIEEAQLMGVRRKEFRAFLNKTHEPVASEAHTGE